MLGLRIGRSGLRGGSRLTGGLSCRRDRDDGAFLALVAAVVVQPDERTETHADQYQQ